MTRNETRPDRGVAARDHRLAGVGAARRDARRRRGRARRLDAGRPPRLRPAVAHALPRRRLAGHHRGDPLEIGTAVGVSNDGVWDPSRPASVFPLETARGTDAGADGAIYVAETSADRVLKVTKDGQVETSSTTRPHRPARRRGGRRRHALHLRHRQRADRQDRPARQPLDVRRRRRPRHARRRRAGHGREPQAAARARAGRRRHALHRRERAATASAGSRRTAASTPSPPTSTCRRTSRSTPRARSSSPTRCTTACCRSPRRARRRRWPATAAPATPATAAPRRRPRSASPTASTSPPTARSTSPTACTTSSAAWPRTARSATYAGTGRSGEEGDGGAPQQAQLTFPEDVTVAPDQSLQIADTGNARIRRAAPGLPGFVDADFSLPSQDGTAVFMFDRTAATCAPSTR